MKKISETVTITSTFHFSGVDKAYLEKSIGNLNSSKVVTFINIPTKCLKVTSDIFSPFLEAIWIQELILNKKFPQKLKLADITPVYKKEDSIKVKNYRPVSILPTVSKIFERLMQKQISDHINQFLSPFLCSYSKRFSIQTTLLCLFEKWKHPRDQSSLADAILMNFSKAFDTINYDLLIAKLH